MMRNKISKLSLCGSALLLLGACDDYLDPNEYSNMEKEQIYAVTMHVGNMSSGIYGMIPQSYDLGMASASDECEEVDDASTYQQFNTGNWNKYSNSDNPWSSCYAGIRIACDVLAETDTLTWADWKYSNPSKYAELIRNLNTVRAEAHFLRAYLYLELIKRYGDVPLLTEKVDMTPGMDLSPYQRTPVQEIINYICDECDIVCREGKYYMTDEQMAEATNNGRKLLKTPYRDTLDIAYPTTGDLSKYLGRATRASAYALKAKALVYHASKLFNPDEDKERWKKAAEACKKVLDLPKASYALESKYKDLFEKKASWSKEFLFARKSAAANRFEKENYPVSIEGGNTGTCPSQNLVDAYEVLENKIAKPFDWNNAMHKSNPYLNRDPRFYLTIYKHGDKYAPSINTLVLDCSEGGNSALPIYHATKTGYYLKKYIIPNLDLKNNKTEKKTWILMRMADYYLYYAEAMNEAYGPDNAAYLGMTARAALNTIRTRAGMPSVIETDPKKFKESVYHERQIELAFENARWWDIRRWKQGKAFSADLRGVKITKSENNMLTYEPMVVEERVFDENKMYLYPIPQTEIDKSSGAITQNPNW